jgi:polyphosphate kinase
VAGVQDAVQAGRPSSTPDQLQREVVLDRIAERSRELVGEQSRIWHEEIRPALAEAGIPILSPAELSERARRAVGSVFDRQIYPVLTPLAVGPGLPFPYISGLSLNLGLIVRDPSDGEARFARVKVPPRIPRFLEADGALVPIEDVIQGRLDRVFPGMEIEESALFRVTRDADFAISDEADDLLGAVEAQLRRRRFGDVVRLEVEAGAPTRICAELTGALGVGEREVYRIPRPLDMTTLWQLVDLDRPDLRDPPWEPITQPRLRGEDREPPDLFAAIRRDDLLVHHPYDDFETSVERFVEQAVEDPDVLAIKQTLYRTSGDTPIVPALMRAAEQGKQTVCLVELQARFDEERNIRWARALERSGVHVVYGHAGVKTHAKLALVVRREGDRVRRYVHIGTGNYHPTTARLYTDIGLFTCRDDVAEDVADLFNYLTGFSRPPLYRKVLVAPEHLRDGLLAEIERVVAAHADGVAGRVVMKLNAIIDGPIIQALYRASQAGVPVDLIVRGICGLRPGLAGLSDNIRVVSIVGRFLEHARIFAFHSGEESRVLIGSADMMARNLDHRVELVAPVDDVDARRELLAALDLMLADTALAWRLDADGRWSRVLPESGEASLNSQEALMERAGHRRAGSAGAGPAARLPGR